MPFLSSRIWPVAVLSCLAACGGGGSDAPSAATASAGGTTATTSMTTTTTSPAPTPSVPSPVPAPTATTAPAVPAAPAVAKNALLAAIEAAVAVPGARVVVVGEADGVRVEGTRRHAELVDVPWSSLEAGTRVMVLPGSYAGPVTLTARGGADAPIRVEPVDPERPPVIRDSVDIQGASDVVVTGLEVRSPTWGGFVIRLGSQRITLARNVVRDAPLGIDITDGAGTGLVIDRNTIEDSRTNAISVSTNGTAAQRNAITGNVLRRSGHHGIELRGSFWRVERNDVSGSGRAIAGTSGIHVFSADPAEDSGDDNLVRYNTSHANADTGASDGNGIQIDSWCDRNTVAFNLVWDNDGAGINLFEAADNLVYANTSVGNNLDPGRTHGAVSEILIGARSVNDRSTGNRVFDNIAVATRAGVPALHVDGRAYLHPNTVGPNLLHNTAGGPVLRWSDSLVLRDAASIDTVTGTRGNLVEPPAFTDAKDPLHRGFELLRAPGGRGTALAQEVDFGGVASRNGQAYFGAYFFTGP